MPSHAPELAGAHLGDETIAAMLEGALSQESAARARSHIASCADCRRLVSAAIGPVIDANVPPSPSPGAHTLREEIVPGTLIGGRYRIERVLGEGGMGRVFVARQLGLERLVAVKILRPELARDGVAARRFDREARLVASLISDHVVRVHDSGALPTGEPYLVMELLEGEDLATVLARGPVAIEQAIAWIVAACEALAEAHALGIVHRDIKPSNLFVTRQGRLKVLDFGLAKLASPSSMSVTGAGVMLGSPRYMAPEQITGARDVDARADIWSLGATLYHLVTGRPPFAEPTLDAIFASILGGNMPPLHDVPASIAGVILRALSRDPAARFATATELAAALRAPAPRVDDRFEILETLASGGATTVYRARYRQGGREVALKVFVPHVDRLRFAREASIIQRLEHPNTVRLYEHGVSPDGAPFLVLELVRGRTLADELERGPLVPARVARIGAQVLKALIEAHGAGIVHRDITPSNIMLVDHAGEPDFVKVLDFGISVDTAEQDRRSITGPIVGTPWYLAPERIAGAPTDPRSDLYALGLIMAEAIAGAPVYSAASFMAICALHTSTAPVPLRRNVVASSLGPVIARAVAKRVEDRYASARDMLSAIESPARPARSTMPIVVSLLAVVVAAISVGIAVSRSRRVATVAPPDAAPSVVIGSMGTGETIIGSRKPGVTIIGPIDHGSGTVEAPPVPAGSSAPPRGSATPRAPASDPMAGDPPPAPRPTAGAGPLGNLDEGRLRKRIARIGWDIKEVTRESFPGCHHTRFQLQRPDGSATRWADVYLFECDSPASAQGKLKHPLPDSWTVADGSLALMASTPEPGGAFANERASKQLFDALVTP